MIFVLKTSVKTKILVNKLTPQIDRLVAKGKWNFDLEDCDRILRIDSEENIVLRVMHLLRTYDINCEILD
jgi:hypothetical protein